MFQPGMVTTDLLMSGVNTKQVVMQPSYITIFCLVFWTEWLLCYMQEKFFINVLAEPAEVVRIS